MLSYFILSNKNPIQFAFFLIACNSLFFYTFITRRNDEKINFNTQYRNSFTGAPLDEAVYAIESQDTWKNGVIKNVKKIERKVFPTTITQADG